MKGKILVVDDEKKTVEILKLYLLNEGFHVDAAYNGRDALKSVRQLSPDLVILDLMLPKVDGLDVCSQLRSVSDIPIIMLTARTTEEDKLIGLELGADDYITKPFSPREVLARVKAVLRRAGYKEENGNSQLVHGDLVIDFLRHEARIKGNPVHLTPKEFKLLEILASNPGRAYSRAELLLHAFGTDYEGLDRTIDVHMMNLRKKIEAAPDTPTYIKTVYGVGYKFLAAQEIGAP